MKLIKSKVSFDGFAEKRNVLIGFEGDEIKYVGNAKPGQDGVYTRKKSAEYQDPSKSNCNNGFSQRNVAAVTDDDVEKIIKKSSCSPINTY